jgi:large subunit ribosomal protein L17
MHRHGYKGRKFGRLRDQRNALIRGLEGSLVEHADTGIVTTLPKAKDLRPVMEKLITRAKKGDLASRRIVISKLSSVKRAGLLVDVIAPQVKSASGYLRITREDANRRGDNAEMARIEFVDKIVLKDEAKADANPVEKAEIVSKPAEKPLAKKADDKSVIARSEATKQSSNNDKKTGSPRTASGARDDNAAESKKGAK